MYESAREAHVLIVEDHEENRDLLKLLLQANGYRVTAAGDGIEALDAARHDAPDVVVSDALMPRMDGFALCHAWMQDAELKSIPFIFYSATYVRPEDERFALALGAVRFLIKPVEAEVFLRELREVLAQWAGVPAPVAVQPLDEATTHALHESALERKLEDKMAQLEAANRKLRESEARFRSLTEMSSDFYWESDAEHRLTLRTAAAEKRSTVAAFDQGAQIGKRRWEIPHLSPDAAGWAAHRAALDARQPFRDFELSRQGKDGSERFISISGNPVFDASGAFLGYRGVGSDITARKRAERALRESAVRYRSLFDSMLNGFACCRMEYDDAQRPVDFVYLEVNQAFGRITGLKDVRGKKVSEVIPGIRELSPELFETYGRVAAGGAPQVFEFDFKSMSKWLTIAVYSPAAGEFVAIFDDITERKAAEAKLRRQTQFYAALSQCNEAIVCCTDEGDLFARICRVAVEFGGMQLAWIGMVDAESRTIRCVARFGEHAEAYLRGMQIEVDGASPLGQGPSGTAVRENRPVWIQDFQGYPRTAPWHERRADFGFGASASLPLHRNGAAVGVLTLYAGEIYAFDEAARRLLTEMATDISFALDNLAREAERVRAEKNLRAAEEQFRGLVEQSIAGIYMVQDGRLVYANPRCVEILGYERSAELVGCEAISFVAEKDRTMVAEKMRQRIAGEAASAAYTFSAVRKDGSTIDVGVHGSRATHEGRPAIIGMIQDISEKQRAEEQIQRYIRQLESAFMSTVEVATSLGEMRDPYTAGHQRRVAEIAVAIGAELGFDSRRQEGLRVAGYLHDIGKIKIPSEILVKPARLHANEMLLVREHAQASYEVLKRVEFPWPIAEIALQHHERMDGSGYPQGLKGDAILPEARILAVADVVEAISTHRPYRPAIGIDAALAEIERGRGSLYDAEVVDACLRLFRDKGFQLPA